MDKSVLDVITDHLVNERLDNILLQNPEYKKTMDEIDQAAEQAEICNFTDEENQMIRRLISAYVSQGACHNKMAYQQGFKDCISLLKEIDLIG